MNTRPPKLHLIRELGQHADKLRSHDGFRVAAEAYEGATMCGCGGDLLALLWSLVEREAKAAEKHLAEQTP